MRLIWSVCLAVLLAAPVCAQTQPLPFRIGEKAVYDVIIQVKGQLNMKGKLGVNIVEVVALTNIRGIEAVHCKADVYSLKNPWYSLHDVFNVYSDVTTLMPLRIEKFIQEGTWENRVIIDYYYGESNYAVYNDKRTTNKILELPPEGAHDILSTFFYIRGADKTTPTVVYWSENDTPAKRMSITYRPSANVRVKPVNSKQKIAILNAKADNAYGFDIGMARNYGYLPVFANVPAFNIEGYEIAVQGVITEYYADYADREKREKKK